MGLPALRLTEQGDTRRAEYQAYLDKWDNVPVATPVIPHSQEAYDTVLVALERILGYDRGQWRARVKRPQIVETLRKYCTEGGTLPSVPRGRSDEQHRAFLCYNRFLKGTVRDIVEENPDVPWSVSSDDIHHRDSPFEIKAWDRPLNAQSPTNIVIKTVRTSW